MSCGVSEGKADPIGKKKAFGGFSAECRVVSAGYSFDYPSGSPGLPASLIYHPYKTISSTSDELMTK
jgi:hypothetical protein